MKTLSRTFSSHVMFKNWFEAKTVLVLSSDWLGEEMQEMVWVQSRHQDSLWLRQEKPHLHPQLRMEKMHVCVCVLSFQKPIIYLIQDTAEKKYCGFFYKFVLHKWINKMFWT